MLGVQICNEFPYVELSRLTLQSIIQKRQYRDISLKVETRTGCWTSDMKLSLHSETPLSHKNFD